MSTLAADLFENLKCSSSVALGVLDSEGVLKCFNERFQQLLFPEGSSEAQDTIPFQQLLSQKKQAEDQSWSDEGCKSLTFRTGCSLDCHFLRFSEGEVLFFGENPKGGDSSIVEQLAAMNVELLERIRQLQKENGLLKERQNKLEALGNVIPICSHCKCIRRGENDWVEPESFFQQECSLHFSHSLCPRCCLEHYGRAQSEPSGEKF